MKTMHVDSRETHGIRRDEFDQGTAADSTSQRAGLDGFRPNRQRQSFNGFWQGAYLAIPFPGKTAFNMYLSVKNALNAWPNTGQALQRSGLRRAPTKLSPRRAASYTAGCVARTLADISSKIQTASSTSESTTRC